MLFTIVWNQWKYTRSMAGSEIIVCSLLQIHVQRYFNFCK